MYLIVYLVAAIWFLLPAPAYAYLDPGTGIALVYASFSFIGAIFFSLKGVFYALVGKKGADDDFIAENHDIVIFSEGKAYWYTFKPIVEALLRKGQPFSYYTMDIEDPCLTIDHPRLFNRYIGSGNRAFAKIGNIKAGILLSTTPNIGTQGYPIPKSSNVGELIHVFHSFEDLCVYHRGSLDHYDSVFLVGAFEEPIIRKLEDIRQLPKKSLIPGGLPYIDELLAQKEKMLSEAAAPVESGLKTVLIAPSWGEKGCLKEYGWDFVELLAQAGYEVIIRPHPQSWRVEADFMKDLESKLSRYANIGWDKEVDATPSFLRADILVSDMSSVRFDFLLLYQKPVITLEIPAESMQDFERVDLQESWKEVEIAKFSPRLGHGDINRIVEVVRQTMERQDITDAILSFREKNLYNLGNSGEAIADYLMASRNHNRA